MFTVGSHLDDKYRVLGLLGRGGFGEVYLVEDEVIPGRRLALKVLNAARSADPDTLVDEMRALASFAHPGVVAFHHHFVHEGRLTLVMEYCAGGSLHDRLAGGRLASVDEAFRWGGVLCDTLAFVHAKGIVHHDVKPANILFAQDWALKLVDFGVANRRAGTSLYLAPEMLLGEPVSRLDARVDIYALGITLGEALAGEVPFERLPPDEALRARLAHDTVPRGLPRWAEEVLLRATHPTPELRFQTMAEFGEAIRARHVPFVANPERLKAHVMAERAETLLARRKWKAAERLAAHAVRVSPSCTAALLAAGHCHLMLRRTEAAKEFFDRALQFSPRLHVQKELGWLNLEQGNIPLAISLLCDHLDREAADQEACNLLLKCYWLTERYEAGIELARLVLDLPDANDCFFNNRMICQWLGGQASADSVLASQKPGTRNPFVDYNVATALESPASWSDQGPRLKDKLLFQEFRATRARAPRRAERVVLKLQDGQRLELDDAVISLGSLDGNDVVFDAVGVSRRHAAIVNLPGEVWLHDLGSTRGISVDGTRVQGRRYLDGVHRVSLGGHDFELGARPDLLV